MEICSLVGADRWRVKVIAPGGAEGLARGASVLGRRPSDKSYLRVKTPNKASIENSSGASGDNQARWYHGVRSNRRITDYFLARVDRTSLSSRDGCYKPML